MRRSPLGRGDKPLQRTPFNRTPTPPEDKAKPKPRTKRQRNTGPKGTVRDSVMERAGYACERCHRHLGEHGGAIHHRHGRQMGGTKREWVNLPSNLVYLCPPCHLLVTDTQGSRAQHEEDGWLLREGEDPLLTPIIWFGTQKVWLNNKGGPGGYAQPNPDDMPLPTRDDDTREDAA